MKNIFTFIFCAIALISLATRVQGQDNSTCFMLDEHGNPVNLGNLCQSPATSSDSESADWELFPSSEPLEPGVYTVPIEGRLNGIPVIDVVFNNKYVYKMMLDTGASGIVITQSMAEMLKVYHHQTVWVSTPSSQRVAMSSGYMRSVEVAGIEKTNIPVIITPEMRIGLLGQSFFGKYDLTIKSDVIEFRER